MTKKVSSIITHKLFFYALNGYPTARAQPTLRQLIPTTRCSRLLERFEVTCTFYGEHIICIREQALDAAVMSNVMVYRIKECVSFRSGA